MMVELSSSEANSADCLKDNHGIDLITVIGLIGITTRIDYSNQKSSVQSAKVMHAGSVKKLDRKRFNKKDDMAYQKALQATVDQLVGSL